MPPCASGQVAESSVVVMTKKFWVGMVAMTAARWKWRGGAGRADRRGGRGRGARVPRGGGGAGGGRGRRVRGAVLRMVEARAVRAALPATATFWEKGDVSIALPAEYRLAVAVTFCPAASGALSVLVQTPLLPAVAEAR